MSARLAAACLVWTAFLGAGWSAAEDAGSDPVVVTLKDGSRLVGAVVRETEGTLTFRTNAGLEVELARETVASLSAAPPGVPQGPVSAAPAEFSEPNDTRLMFAPTGRPLAQGRWVLLRPLCRLSGLCLRTHRPPERFGGILGRPGAEPQEQVFYVSSTVGWRLSKKAAFSLGGLYATGSEASEAGALLFGVASFGSSNRSLSVGLSLAATRNQEYRYDGRDEYVSSSQWSIRDAPVVMVGGTVRAGKRVSLVAESWLFPGHDFQLSEQPLGMAVRFFGERLSVDVGIVLVAEILDEGFPIPWLSFSYHFGPSRNASKRSSPGALPRLDYGVSRKR